MNNTSNKPAGSSNVMSYVFIFFIIAAVLFAAFSSQLTQVETNSGTTFKSRMEMTSTASFNATKDAVNLAFGLIGMMAFWLGLFKILEVGGFLAIVAKKLKPIFSRLFPDIPPDHPAIGAMVMNISANMFGFGNAATPFGLKAMQELEKLNPFKGTATNAMIMFLAINTSNIALLPLGVIGLRVSAGSSNPAEIFLPSLLATTCSTIVAITVALFLAKKDKSYREAYNKNLPAHILTQQAGDTSALSYTSEAANKTNEKFLVPATNTSKVLAICFLILLLSAFIYRLLDTGIMSCFKSDSALQAVLTFLSNEFGSFWLMPSLMLLIVSYALFNGVKIYDTIVEGAKQGFELAVRIIPFLVVILVAVGMFRASGAMDFCVAILSPLTELIGLPAEVLPMAIIRPLSGSGAYSFLSSVVNAAPNSYNAFLASVLNGSSETTFYVLAVYFGSVGIVKIRHAVLAALTADIAGVLAACFFSPMFYA